MKPVLGSLAVLAATAAGGDVVAFGTIACFGQNAEHERITRMALACDNPGPCLGPKTLHMLAGRQSEHRIHHFGAVGIPDRSSKLLRSEPHCRNGDALDIEFYPRRSRDHRTPGESLEACRAYAAAKLDEAVTDAGRLLDSRGRLRPGQAPTNCVFWFGVPGRAKCNALEAFGIMLHTAQDFYAHSNWTDRPDPTQPIGPDNPPGLGHEEAAPWFSLRDEALRELPEGLITGCWGLFNEMGQCSYETPDGARVRVTHARINKDRGAIGEAIGPGATRRGTVEADFERAVKAAILDTRDKWALFELKLAQRYGEASGALIACALRSDDARTCEVAPPQGPAPDGDPAAGGDKTPEGAAILSPEPGAP